MKPPFLPPDMSKRSFSWGGSAKNSRASRAISATSAASTPWSTTWKMPQPSHAAATCARISPRRSPPPSMPSRDITGTSSLKLLCGTLGRSSSSRTNDGRSVASDDAVGRNGAAALLKLDIAKAFDTVRWDFLLEVLDRMGFGHRWRAWITTLLASASSTVLLNGTRGRWFSHNTGLRQGDPLSPMLFILAMEPLQLMLNKAIEQGLLTPINSRKATLRTSLFADDAAILLNPVRQEVTIVKQILNSFGAASGLITNTQKSAVYPIRCEGLSLQHIMEAFQCPIKSFPCTYLGLPLHTRQLCRVDIQPIIDKIGARLATWKGKLLNRAGRLRLINTVLTSLPMYHLTVFRLQKWAIKKIDKMRRGFLWKGTEEAQGGHCLVQWARCLRPKNFGGLGILDLDLFSRALRLRWLWYQWTDTGRPWTGTEPPVNAVDRQLFRASTVVTLGDGKRASFWQSAWLNGRAPMDIFPDLFKLAWRKNRSVKEELEHQSWTRGLWRMESVNEMANFITLWDLVQSVQLTEEPDTIRWKWTSHGDYSAKTAYNIQFAGSHSQFQGSTIWKAEAEGKHKFLHGYWSNRNF